MTIIKESIGKFGDKIQLVNQDGEMLVLCNGFVHSSVRDFKHPSTIYALNFMNDLFKQTDPKSVLVLGLGAGDSVGRILYQKPETEVRAIEIEPYMIYLANRYNYVPESVVTEGDVFEQVHLLPHGGAYDLVLHDVFTLDLERKDEYVDRFDQSYWDAVVGTVNPDKGVLCLNTIPCEGEHINSIRILKKKFNYVQSVLLDKKGNRMYVFYNCPSLVSFDLVAMKKNALNTAKVETSTLF